MTKIKKLDHGFCWSEYGATRTLSTAGGVENGRHFGKV
jgi:hypothetical protein